VLGCNDHRVTDADGVTPIRFERAIVESVGNGVRSQARGLRIAVIAIAGVIAATDQLSKSIVLATHAGTAIPRSSGWFSIELVRNHGVSTGIGASHPLIVTAVEAVGTVFVAALALRVRRTALALALAAVLGGALGNLLDRFVRAPGLGRGAVVDWIHLAGRGGSLDLADVAIQLGALVALIATLLGSRGGRAAPTEDARTEARHRPPPT
jgi:signal peptidase II